MPASAAWDGASRKLELRTTRPGARVQGPNGYIATPPDESGPILAYELPLLEALKASDARKDLQDFGGLLTNIDLLGAELPENQREQHRKDLLKLFLRAKQELVIDADRPLPVEADGEVLGNTPMTVEVIAQPIMMKL